MNEKLRRRLVKMAEEDRHVRQSLADRGLLFEGYHPDMRRVHERNARSLEEILDDHGWPTAETVGDDGAEAAWLIAQHAIGLPDFQRRCLQELDEAAADSKTPKWQSAMLLDRIRVFEGRPQIYGTQMDWDDSGEINPNPIEDPTDVDARRASVGLPPLTEAIERQRREAAAAGERPPTDPAARRREADAWARSVGWRK